MNKLLQRVLNFDTQELLPAFQPDIPAHCVQDIHAVARQFPNCQSPVFPAETQRLTRAYDGAPDCQEKLQALLNYCWKPTLTVIGIEGLPSDLSKAGNVIYSQLKYRLSMRTAPNQDTEVLAELLRKAFMEAPVEDSFGAKVEFQIIDQGNGFCAPDLPEDIKSVVYQSSKDVFDGKDPLFVGIGGSIPFMGIFATEFPTASFLLTGCATPESNPHCANENINLEHCRRFITAISLMLSRL